MTHYMCLVQSVFVTRFEMQVKVANIQGVAISTGAKAEAWKVTSLRVV